MNIEGAITDKIRSLHLTTHIGKCRIVTFEVIKHLRLTGLIDEAHLLIDRSYLHLIDAKIGEHVIGLVRKDHVWYAFDGTVAQLQTRLPEGLKVWSGSFPEVLAQVQRDIGGSWDEEIIGPGWYAKLLIEC